ncbi:MAG: hypothetical protein Q9166_008141 [cf. Caloplaca sp. 2 TL-2023]
MAVLSRDSTNELDDHNQDLDNLSLGQPLISMSLRHQFLERLYRPNISIEDVENTDSGFQAFFNRYKILHRSAANRHGSIDNCTYGDLSWVVKMLRKNEISREKMDEIVLQRLDRINRFHATSLLVDLAASVWSQIIVGRFSGDISYDDPITWVGPMFLHPGLKNRQPNLINNLFPPPSYMDNVKLPQSFTAANLEKIGGMQVLWTNSLTNHLLLQDDDTKVMLFHHVSALRLQQYYPSNALPRALADETIRTIALLIPPSLGAKSPWFQQEQRKHGLDSEAGICDRLNSSERQIEKFYFWRERLVLLKRTYDDAEPKNLLQLWWDDRKKTQWFTFWVAVLVFIMTVFFGVIQSVAAIVQAWASVKSLKAQD